jgi:hypothetical protein
MVGLLLLIEFFGGTFVTQNVDLFVAGLLLGLFLIVRMSFNVERCDLEWREVRDGKIDLLDNVNVVPSEDIGIPIILEGLDFGDGVNKGRTVGAILHGNWGDRYLPVCKQVEEEAVHR